MLWWPLSISAPLWCYVNNIFKASLKLLLHHPSVHSPELLWSAGVRVHAPHTHTLAEIGSLGLAKVHGFGGMLVKTHTDTSKFHPTLRNGNQAHNLRLEKVAGINESSSTEDVRCTAGCEKTEIVIPTTLCPKATPASPRVCCFHLITFCFWLKKNEVIELKAQRSHIWGVVLQSSSVYTTFTCTWRSFHISLTSVTLIFLCSFVPFVLNKAFSQDEQSTVVALV